MSAPTGAGHVSSPMSYQYGVGLTIAGPYQFGVGLASARLYQFGVGLTGNGSYKYVQRRVC